MQCQIFYPMIRSRSTHRASEEILAMTGQTVTPEMRAIAAGIAAAHPLTSAREIRATGNHRTAQNDEPDEFAAADLTYVRDRDARRTRDEAELQRMDADARRARGEQV